MKLEFFPIILLTGAILILSVHSQDHPRQTYQRRARTGQYFETDIPAGYSRFYQRRIRRSASQIRSNLQKSIPWAFNENEFRTEVIVPVMNIMGLGLSVFGNLYPIRQLRNDDGTPMNATDLKAFRSQMNAFHQRFFELGQSLTNVVEQSRALRNPFQVLGRKIALSRILQSEERRLAQQRRMSQPKL